MFKKKIARWFVDWTDSWNHELHDAIEAKIRKAYSDAYSDPDGGTVDLRLMNERMKELRDFYYARMTNTSMLLLAAAALAVSIVALAVSLVHS